MVNADDREISAEERIARGRARRLKREHDQRVADDLRETLPPFTEALWKVLKWGTVAFVVIFLVDTGILMVEAGSQALCHAGKTELCPLAKYLEKERLRREREAAANKARRERQESMALQGETTGAYLGDPAGDQRTARQGETMGAYQESTPVDPRTEHLKALMFDSLGRCLAKYDRFNDNRGAKEQCQKIAIQEAQNRYIRGE
ncbi:MAG: hypothetical protein RLZZ468_1032 [Cyanobacteriota bacterium]|jgi:hypothetical protein